MKQLIRISLCLALCLTAKMSFAQDSASSSEDEAAIRKAGQDYLKAFHAGDAKALAQFWSPEAVYVNRLTGEQAIGREEIAEQLAQILKEIKGIKMQIDVQSIDFVSPNVAVEQGVAQYFAPGGEPEVMDYSAVYVRRGGQWLLDRVTDKPQRRIKSHYEQLQPLEWLVGSWIDEDKNAEVVTDCSWTKNQNFITRSFTVSIGDQIDLSGMQVIGWDAADKQIKSWTFDSDGGISTGRWTQEGNRWYIKKTGVLPEGSRATSTNIIKQIDEDTLTIQSIQRTVDGAILPNVDEIRIIRTR